MGTRRSWSIAVVAILPLLWGCGSGGGTSSTGTEATDDTSAVVTPEAIDSIPFAVSVAESARTYDASDVVENVVFDDTIAIDFTAGTATPSSGISRTITTDGITVLGADGGSVVVTRTAEGVTVHSTVDSAVQYELTGQLDGTLTISSSNIYQLLLDDLTINGTVGPAIDLESTQKVFIVSPSGSNSVLADSASRTMTMKAALCGKGPMIFSGDGSLRVAGSYKHGIFSGDYIRVRGGAIDVDVSARDAVRAVNAVVMDDGNLTIDATGSTIDDESKGIRVEGSETSGTGMGYIVVNGGHLEVTSVGKAITAGWDIDEDATTTTTADDPSPDVEINHGVITLTTTGTPYEYQSGGGTVSCSPEGIEAKGGLAIRGGHLTINTTDDALNAGTSAVISGGYCYCASSDNDAIDSNGDLTIEGGVVVAIGADDPEGPFDCDQNTFLITGGTLVGIGGTTSRLTATQNTIVLGAAAAGSLFSLEAADGTTAFAFEVPRACQTLVLTSPDIRDGAQYTIGNGGTVSATNVFGGLYLGSLACAGATPGDSFAVTSTVTKLGGVYF